MRQSVQGHILVRRRPKSGNGIASVVNYYMATNENSGITTSTKGWLTTIPAIGPKQRYLWNYEVTTYTDAWTNVVPPHVIATFTEDGRGISNIEEWYGLSNNPSKAPSSWRKDVPQMSPEQRYLWNKETITYTTGNPKQIPPHVIGVYGEKGKDGLSPNPNLLYNTDFSKPGNKEWYLRTGIEIKRGKFGTTCVRAQAYNTEYLDFLAQLVVDDKNTKGIAPSTWYTLSFWAKGTNVRSYLCDVDNPLVDTDSDCYLNGVNQGKPSGDGRCIYNVNDTSDWVHQSYTFKTKSQIALTRLLFRLQPNDYIYISAIKLEEGMEATPWCLSEYDRKGDAGLEGCIVRTTEWAPGVTYHNDSNETFFPRFLDQIVVSNPDNPINPYNLYRCLKTHTSSESLTYLNPNYWQKLNNMEPICTPLIVAQNAVMKFGQANHFYILDDTGKIVCQLGGGEYPLWLGNGELGMEHANFKVDKNGIMYAEGGVFKGDVYARNGIFNGSISIQSQPIPEQKIVYLDFESGFNFAGCSFEESGKEGAYYEQKIILPTDIKYDGVECLIQNTAFVTDSYTTEEGKIMIPRRFVVEIKNNDSFIVNSLAGYEISAKQIEVIGRSFLRVHAVIMEGSLKWVIDNSSDVFKSTYIDNILSTARGIRPANFSIYGIYEIVNRNNVWSQIPSENSIYAIRQRTGVVKFTFEHPVTSTQYMPIVTCLEHGYGFCSSKTVNGFTIETADDASNNDLDFEMMVRFP